MRLMCAPFDLFQSAVPLPFFFFWWMKNILFTHACSAVCAPKCYHTGFHVAVNIVGSTTQQKMKLLRLSASLRFWFMCKGSQIFRAVENFWQEKKFLAKFGWKTVFFWEEKYWIKSVAIGVVDVLTPERRGLKEEKKNQESVKNCVTLWAVFS